MVNSLEFETKLKKGILDNCYVFCGADELLIKEAVQNIISRFIDKNFSTFNCIKFDGNKIDFDAIVNACETVPFMSDKKVVIIYRASFLQDNNFKKENASNRKKDDDIFKNLSDYIGDIPSHCILIMYYVFQSERDKPSSKIRKLEKRASCVEFKKLKGMNLEKKVKTLFHKKNKEIGKVELSLFCNSVENNLNIIENEVEKLCSYTEGRDITHEDITTMLPQKSDNDVFNLVDFLSQKKPEKALDVLNELLFRGEKIPKILAMIERQYKILFSIKLGLEDGKDENTLYLELKLHPFVCKKMIIQSKKFTLKQLQKYIELCLITEKRLKSLSIDGKTEMELLIINSARM